MKVLISSLQPYTINTPNTIGPLVVEPLHKAGCSDQLYLLAEG